MCCTRLPENTGRKKSRKNRHLRTIAQICPAISSQLRHVSTIGKKHVKQQHLLHTFSQYGELPPIWRWLKLFVVIWKLTTSQTAILFPMYYDGNNLNQMNAESEDDFLHRLATKVKTQIWLNGTQLLGYFCDPLWVSPRFLASGTIHGLSCPVVCVILRLAVSAEHWLVTDGQTDDDR